MNDNLERIRKETDADYSILATIPELRWRDEISKEKDEISREKRQSQTQGLCRDSYWVTSEFRPTTFELIFQITVPKAFRVIQD
jgi:hypothetical protein